MNDGVALDIQIYNNGMAEINYKNGNLSKSKSTNLENIASLLASHASSFSPLLPEGTMKYGFRNSKFKVLISFDEVFYRQKYSVCNNWTDKISMSDFSNLDPNYDKDFYDNDDDDDDDDDDGNYKFSVPTYLPKTVFLVELYVDGNKFGINADGTRMYHYFDDMLTRDTDLFLFPFGNIYDAHKLCFGGMNIIDNRYGMEDIRGLRSIFHNWTSAVSNMDLDYKMNDKYNAFDYIYQYGTLLKDVKSLDELKANSELYTEARTKLRGIMPTCGVTFGSLIDNNLR